MNKKTQLFLLAIFFMLLFSSVNAAEGDPLDSGEDTGDIIDGDSYATVTLTWRSPTTTLLRDYNPYPYIALNLVCNTGPCLNLTARLQYCQGINCSNYQNLNITSVPLTGYKMFSTYPGGTEAYTIASLATGATWTWGSGYYPAWMINTYTGSPDTIYRLRMVVTGTNINPTTKYLSTGKSFLMNFPPIATLTAPSNGTSREQGQQLTIAWNTSDANNDNIRSQLYYAPQSNCTLGAGTNFYSTAYQTAGAKTYNWTIPSIPAGNYCIFVRPDDAPTSTSVVGSLYGSNSNSRNITITEPPPTEPETFLNASILTPFDGNNFFVGTTISFKSNISSSSTYTVQWDSNKDIGWNPTDENLSYSGLSIGDHNISFTVTTDTNTTRDSIEISIKPITADVFSISNFELIPVEPAGRFSVNGKIRVKAKVNYFISEPVNAKAFIIISDATTHQAIYGPSPFYLTFNSPDFEEYDLNIDLSSYDFFERNNYKIEFLVVSNEVESSPEYYVNPTNPNSAYWDDGEPYYIPEEQIPEQNKANNSGYQIIELGPTTIPSVEAPEINPAFVLVVLFSVLLLTRKK
ncbi:MAG: hypothetical protein ABIJ74_01635 [archaeon]